MKNMSYVIIQYRHSQLLDEAINVGVVVHDAESQFAAVAFESQYGHLSALYEEFDGIGFRRALRQLQVRLDFRHNGEKKHPKLDLVNGHDNAYELVRSVWPDGGAALVATPPRFLVAERVEEVAEHLLSRMVAQPRGEGKRVEARDDEDLWEDLARRMNAVEGLAARFAPKNFDDEIEFRHVAWSSKREAFLVLEPMSFDYLSPDSIKERAFELVGKKIGVSDPLEIWAVVGERRRLAALEPTVIWACDYMARRDVHVVFEAQFDTREIA